MFVMFLWYCNVEIFHRGKIYSLCNKSCVTKYCQPDCMWWHALMETHQPHMATSFYSTCAHCLLPLSIIFTVTSNFYCPVISFDMQKKQVLSTCTVLCAHCVSWNLLQYSIMRCWNPSLQCNQEILLPRIIRRPCSSLQCSMTSSHTVVHRSSHIMDYVALGSCRYNNVDSPLCHKKCN